MCFLTAALMGLLTIAASAAVLPTTNNVTHPPAHGTCIFAIGLVEHLQRPADPEELNMSVWLTIFDGKYKHIDGLTFQDNTSIFIAHPMFSNPNAIHVDSIMTDSDNLSVAWTKGKREYLEFSYSGGVAPEQSWCDTEKQCSRTKWIGGEGNRTRSRTSTCRFKC